MNDLIIKNNRFFLYLNNLESDSLGYYFSFILHFFIFLFALGLPNFFEREPISIPNIIPIEIINITDTTFITKLVEEKEEKDIKQAVVKQAISEKKKFNNSNNQEIKKVEINKKPKTQTKESENMQISNDNIIIKEKSKKQIKLTEKNKIVTNEKIESLPTKKIKPKIKPKPKSEIVTEEKKSDIVVKAKPKIKPEPKSEIVTEAKPKIKPEPQFSIATMLKDLRNESSSQLNKKIEQEKESENVSKQEEKIAEEKIQLSISEIDLLRQQLSSCWIAPAGAVIEKGMVVKISAKLKQNSHIYDNSVRIVDTNISKSNPFYGPITESAMRTLLNPDCIPLKLPKEKYNLWKNLTITFDYSIMKGYQ